MPRHVAIIMDGNGRWAQARNKPRSFGHERGAARVKPIVVECDNLGIEALTLYSFSTENWARSKGEVDCLMDLYVQYLVGERQELDRNNVRVIHIGRRDGLPASVTKELDRTVELTTSNTGLQLAVALNYGSRSEITDAVRTIAAEVAAGRLDPQQISEKIISDHLYTAGLPDPDLLIRTAGEMRLSNYLLWQISYAELYVADAYWPDFDTKQLHAALSVYANRKRNFGAIT